MCYDAALDQAKELSEEVQRLEMVIAEIKDISEKSNPDDKAFYYLSAIDAVVRKSEDFWNDW